MLIYRFILLGLLWCNPTMPAESEAHFDLVMFEDNAEPEEEANPELVIIQEQPQFSLADLPFYATILWGYFYEEKLYPTYAVVTAWFQQLFKKRTCV